MKIMKFGGTSVGSAERIKEVANLVSGNEKKIVVLSAMSGTTNNLVEITGYLYKKNNSGANKILKKLESKYYIEIDALYSTKKMKDKATELVHGVFKHLRSFKADGFSDVEEKDMLAQGELISTAMLNFYLNEQGVKSQLLPALDFMRIGEDNEPDTSYIRKNLSLILEKFSSTSIFITQGYICRNSKGNIDNLQRGGSDYSASLIGAAIDADEIQIWTDIDGMHNNDPRFVENTSSVANLSFDEAAELAYFGAKILHPTSVLPAKLANIPVKVLNTLEPDAPGTTISSSEYKNRLTAVAAKDDIVAIRIQSDRMFLAYGFLRKVFDLFEKFKTSIDMITTSEVGVSVTIDNKNRLEDIVDGLKEFGAVEGDYDQVIICVVGDLVRENKGYANRVFEALKDIPIRMISYGGSDHNISVLIASEYKKEALNALSAKLFNS